MIADVAIPRGNENRNKTKPWREASPVDRSKQGDGERTTGGDLAVGGAVGLDGPAGLVAERLEHLVVVAVLGELVVTERAEPREDLGGDGPAPALAPLVVLPLLPRRRAPQTARGRRRRRHAGRCPRLALLPPLSLMARRWVAYCAVSID